MCGFLGRINLTPGLSEERLPLTSALPILKRRGPDSHQIWQSGDRRVELLHCRLAIVDVDNRATQPFSDDKTGLTIVFNGEVYNYRELRNELGDFSFRTESDTEVLLAVFSKWGIEGLKRVRGMFSCAIADREKKTVTLFRDPIGKKPLFVAVWGKEVLFGSSLLAMAACSRSHHRIRKDCIAEFWSAGHLPPDQSILDGCQPVLPGSCIEFDYQGKIIRRGSCIPDFQPMAPRSLEEAEETIAALLKQSIRRRMHNNPFPVSLLSGGVDSTVITSFMAASSGAKSLTLGSLLPLSLDEKYARYAARRMNIPLQVLRLRLGRIEDEVEWALNLQDEPLGMISYFLLSLLVRAAKQHGKILLTGDGGDEVFLGYGKPSDWVGTSREVTPSKLRVGPPLPSWMSTWGQSTATEVLLGHMLPKTDRATAEQGIEARCPLLDWDLMAYVRQLPPEYIFYSGKPKAILKSVLNGWPRWFVERPKVGFAYNLRWAWGAKGYRGLREMVSKETVETFEAHLPIPLRKNPSEWGAYEIFGHFPQVWKLLVWGQFCNRLANLRNVAESSNSIGASVG